MRSLALRPARLALCAGLLLFGGISCSSTPAHDPEADETAIRTLLEDAQAAWNEGDLERYMNSYWRDPQLRFASGDRISTGWDSVLEKYRRAYPDRTAMGDLTFSDIDVRLMGPDAALAFGRWRLDGLQGLPHGLFSLVLQRLDVGWRIVHDHTSAACPPPPEDH